MSQKSIELKEGLPLIIHCQGDLSLRGAPESILWVRGDEIALQETPAGLSLTGEGDLVVSVPRRTPIILAQQSGDVSLVGLAGTIQGGEVAGGLSLVDLAGPVTLEVVRGDMAVRTLGAPLSVREVNGDVSIRGAQAITFGTIHGDLSARAIDGAATIGPVMGDASLRGVQGDLTIEQVHGDCALADLRGLNAVSVADDIRLSGSLAAGKHIFSAESSITLNWPIDAPLNLTATAPRIINRLDLLETASSGDTLTGRLGQGNVFVTLIARDRIALKPEKPEAARGMEFGFESSMAGLGEMITTEINARLAELTTRLGPELSTHAEERAERIADRVQRAMDKAMRKMDLTLQRAERQRSRHTPPTPPRPPVPPTPPTPPKADTTQEQFAILKMLQEGKISVEEANKLLDTLS